MKTKILLLISMVFLISCNTNKNIVNSTANNNNNTNSNNLQGRKVSTGNSIIAQSEVMPSIKSCGQNDLYNKTGSCTNNKLSTFIYDHLKYPDIGKENKVSGIVAVKFVVEKDGSLSNIGIKCNKIYGTEKERKAFADEAVRVIKEMQNSNIEWNSGIQGGQPVRSYYYYPIRFKTPK